jgi:hypothetical protein
MSDLIEVDNTIKIWGVVSGPFSTQDIEEWDEPDDAWMVVCQVENDYGGLDVEEITFHTFDDAYEVVAFFKHGKAPFLMEVED